MNPIPFTAKHDNAFIVLAGLLGIVFFWLPVLSQYANGALQSVKPLWSFREAVTTFSFFGKIFLVAYCCLSAVVLGLCQGWFPRKSQSSSYEIFPTADRMKETDFSPRGRKEWLSYWLYFTIGKSLSYIGIFIFFGVLAGIYLGALT